MVTDNKNIKDRSSHPEVFCKKLFLKISQTFTGKNLCTSLLASHSLLTLVEVFSCKFYQIFTTRIRSDAKTKFYLKETNQNKAKCKNKQIKPARKRKNRKEK